MSTKSTILLTSDNEHWYNDCNSAYYEETKTQEAIVLQIHPRHKVETDEDGTRIIIEEGTPLYNSIKGKLRL
jgi:hypothetical protein